MDTLPQLIEEFETFCGGERHTDTRRMLNAWKLGLLDDDKFELSARLMGGADFDEMEDGTVAQFYRTVLSGTPGDSAPALFQLLGQASSAYFHILKDHHYTPILSKGVVYDVTPEVTRDMVWGSHGTRISQMYTLDALCVNLVAFLCTLSADYRVHFCHTYWAQFLDYVMDELDTDDLAGADLDHLWDQLVSQPDVHRQVHAYAHILYLCQFDTLVPILDVYRPAIDLETKHLYRFFWTKLEPLATQVSKETEVERLFYGPAHDLNQRVLAQLAKFGRRVRLEAQDYPVDIETLQGGGRFGKMGSTQLHQKVPERQEAPDRHTQAVLGHLRWIVSDTARSAKTASNARTIGGVPRTGPSTQPTGPSTQPTGPSTQPTGPSTQPTGPSTKKCGRSLNQTRNRRKCGPRSGPSIGAMLKAGLGGLGAAAVYINFDKCNFKDCTNDNGNLTAAQIIILNDPDKYINASKNDFNRVHGQQTYAAGNNLNDALDKGATIYTTETGKAVDIFQYEVWLTEAGKANVRKLQADHIVCVESIEPARAARDQFRLDNAGSAVPAAVPYLAAVKKCEMYTTRHYTHGIKLGELVQAATDAHTQLLDMVKLRETTAHCMLLPSELVDFFAQDAAAHGRVPLPFYDDHTLCVLTLDPTGFATYDPAIVGHVFDSFTALRSEDKADSAKVKQTVCKVFQDEEVDPLLWPLKCAEDSQDV